MKPYDYLAPASLREALSLLERANGEVRPLAGGTDLIAQIRERRRQPDAVMDVKRIPECTRLDFDDAGLHIGAATTCTAVAEHPTVRERYPILVDGCRLIGSLQIQNRAAIGGNMCNAAPSADTIPALICLGGRAVVAGPKGMREVPVEKFFAGPGKTVLERGEMLVEVIVPPPMPSSAGSYLRFIPRAEMDIAVAGVGSLVAVDSRTKRCIHAVVALAAVAPTPVRAAAAEQTLMGNVLSHETIAAAAERAVLAARPITDVRGTVEYRKELVKVLTHRTLTRCAATLGRTL